MLLPRDIDIQSGAFLLFAFVIVISFGVIGTSVIGCRVFNLPHACFGTDTADAVKDYVKGLIDILLALMVGGARRQPKPPPPEEHDVRREPPQPTG
jgi:hypothetical protein